MIEPERRTKLLAWRKSLAMPTITTVETIFVDFEAIAYTISSILRSIVSYRANNLKPTSDFIGQDDEVAGKRHWVLVIMLN